MQNATIESIYEEKGIYNIILILNYKFSPGFIQRDFQGGRMLLNGTISLGDDYLAFSTLTISNKVYHTSWWVINYMYKLCIDAKCYSNTCRSLNKSLFMFLSLELWQGLK